MLPINYLLTNHKKQELILNNPQWLVYHKTLTNQESRIGLGFFIFYFPSVVVWISKICLMRISFLILIWVFSLGFCNPFVLKSPREFYFVHILGQSLVCAYTIYQYGKILISCTFLCGSPFLTSHVYSCIPFEPVYCIHLYG